MVREDIISGMKNAIERGATLQQAIQSLINAGYNPPEVQQAAQIISQGAIQVSSKPSQVPPDQNQNPQANLPAKIIQQPQGQIVQPTRQEIKRLPSVQNERNKNSSKTVIFITLLMIILLLLLGALTYVLFFGGREVVNKLFT